MSLWDRLMSFFHISRKRPSPYVVTSTPTPTPVVSFSVAPSITTDGSPTVGESVTFGFGTVANGAVGTKLLVDAADATIATISKTAFTLTQSGQQRLKVFALGSTSIYAYSPYITVAAPISPDGDPTPIVTLGALAISSTAFVVGTASSGTISGDTAGSIISLANAPAGFTINSPARTWAYDGTGTAATGNLSLTETLAGASPKQTNIAYTVTAAPIVLGTLGLSSTAFVVGTASSGTITGAKAGSSLAITNGPSGLTINGAARTWAYDGTGAASSGNLTLTETLAGATGSPNPTTIGYTVSVPSAITAPTLARTSASGAAPLTWSTQLNQDNTFAGYIYRVQVAAGLNPAKNSDGSYVMPTQDIFHLLSPSEVEAQDISVSGDGFVTPSGAYALQSRIERDDGVASPWSNALSDTITAAVAVFNPTAGVARHVNMILSNANRTATPTGNGGSRAGVRANNPAAATKFHVELTVLANASYDSSFGIENGNTDFSVYGPTPGSGDANGFNIGFAPDHWYYGYNSNQGGNANNNVQNGDTIVLECDTVAGIAKFYIVRSGASTPATGLSPVVTISGQPFANWYFWYASKGGSVTVNTGNLPFAMTPTAGFVPYG